jgi:hypothetical protein
MREYLDAFKRLGGFMDIPPVGVMLAKPPDFFKDVSRTLLISDTFYSRVSVNLLGLTNAG